jgi:hypothetical protein
MAICGGCGAERTRTRTIFHPDGTVRTEECQSCAPGSFDPSWLTARGVPAWEAYPEKYDKFDLPDGRTGYRAKPEWSQDSEDKIRKSYEKADQVEASALEKKRRNRRTTPMTPEEIACATERFRPQIEDRIEQGNRAWNAAIKELIQ